MPGFVGFPPEEARKVCPAFLHIRKNSKCRCISNPNSNMCMHCCKGCALHPQPRLHPRQQTKRTCHVEPSTTNDTESANAHQGKPTHAKNVAKAAGAKRIETRKMFQIQTELQAFSCRPCATCTLLLGTGDTTVFEVVSAFAWLSRGVHGL